MSVEGAAALNVEVLPLDEVLRQTGAALDVYEQGPIAADNPLLGMDNVVLCSHAAWFSVDAFQGMKVGAAQAVVDSIQGRTLRNILNPDVLSAPNLRKRLGKGR